MKKMLLSDQVRRRCEAIKVSRPVDYLMLYFFYYYTCFYIGLYRGVILNKISLIGQDKWRDEYFLITPLIENET